MSSPSPADDMGPPSSFDHSAISSSPPRPLTYGVNGRKERRDPSVTPRKFRRFFTPRSHGFQSSSRQALYDITAPALNRNAIQSSPLRPFRSVNGLESSPIGSSRASKKRKLVHTPDTSPQRISRHRSRQGDSHSTLENILSSPCERAAPNMEYIDEEEEETDVEEPEVTKAPLKRINPISERGLAGQMLNTSLGITSRSRRQHLEYPINDWQDDTSKFYSTPKDVHMSMSIEGNERTIPFCASGLNTNSLVAVGDEEGRVRLLESAKGGKPTFQSTYVAFRVHTNAIIDMSFSEDDSLLATASGDQSARVIDMTTQTTISILGNHRASLKQVRFQPGVNNNSILATSSRDGSIQIWDLRVNGYDGPSHNIYAPVDSGRPNTRAAAKRVQYGRCVNAIYDVHKPRSKHAPTIGPADTPSRGETAGRVGDVSVTAIQFLGNGLEHLLVSASESDSSLKLWDIRSLATKRKTQIALSHTQQPQSHNKWRHFGVSSLNLSHDGSRLYSLCKDNTVYAYSTAHLMLGYAPELSTSNLLRPSQQPTQEGLGPLYGFRHPNLHVTSFYVKSAIRKPKDGRSELLAVGSSDGCAVLFPTDERYFPRSQPHMEQNPSFSSTQKARPTLRRVGSGLSLRLEDSVPISTNGTALKRGHDREIGSLSWTSEGELITVGDDYLVRCWREGGDARNLRTGGEGEGKRWGCGWAEVSEKYDDDEC